MSPVDCHPGECSDRSEYQYYLRLFVSAEKTDNAIIIIRVDDEVQQKAIETLAKVAEVNLLDRETLLLK